MMTRIRGTSSAKAKAKLEWSPRYQTYREGFRYGLSRRPGVIPDRDQGYP